MDPIARLHAMSLHFGSILASSFLFLATPALAAADDACVTINMQEPPANIDMERVRAAWLGWYNDYRATLDLPAYSSDATLERTASNWSYFSVKRGTIDHKRAWQAPYYDYKAIEKWFSNFNVTFKNVGGKTFTENIGWGPYACSKDDCTDELIASIRTTFDFFLGEKNKANRSHYNTIVNPTFTKMGMGIGIDPVTKRYYLTAHFAAEIENAPSVCR